MATKKKNSLKPFELYESRSRSGYEKGYVRLTPSQFHSDSILDLSSNAFRIYIMMKFQARGHIEFIYTYDQAIKDTSISRQTYRRVIDELVNMGLIEELPRNVYAPLKFRFSIKWKNYVSDRRDIYTGERYVRKADNPRPQPRNGKKTNHNFRKG